MAAWLRILSSGLTFILQALGLLGEHLHLLLLPLAQHVALKSGDGAQQLVSAHLGRRQHDAAVQEAVDGVEQVLPVVGHVRGVVELLQPEEKGG